MKLVSKVTEIYCIADDFCNEYHLELNKTSLSLSNSSANSPKHRKRKGRMSDAEMTFIDSTRIPVCENKREYSNISYVIDRGEGEGYFSVKLFCLGFE